MRVLVTFLESKDIDLPSRGIDQNGAAELRARLKTFAEDWERLEASIYAMKTARGDVVMVLFPDSGFMPLLRSLCVRRVRWL
jgi:hypothetical protein